MTDSTSPSDHVVEGADQGLTAQQLRSRRAGVAAFLVVTIGGIAAILAVWLVTGSLRAAVYTWVAWVVACLVVGPTLMIWSIVRQRRRRPGA
jgi:hypothetical protein